MNPPTSYSGEDARLIQELNGETAEAWLWWTHVPRLPGEKVGVIGHFSANGPAAAVALLKKAQQTLAAQECTIAIGPMDGNTWKKYRLVTEAGDAPPFLLEPSNPAAWTQWWQDAGYTPLASYYSTIAEDLAWRDPRLNAVAERVSQAGITLRPLSTTHFEEDLLRIHEVSLEAFQENFLYTPISTGEFLAMYRPLQDRVVPGLVLIAEQAYRPVGYVFSLPDYAQAARGVPMDTVVIKTLAVRKGRIFGGLGALMLAEIHRVALRMKFNRAIHALMHESNGSRNLTARYSTTFRRYALFARKISL